MQKGKICGNKDNLHELLHNKITYLTKVILTEEIYQDYCTSQ